MGKKEILNQLNESIGELSELVSSSAEIEYNQVGMEELDKSEYEAQTRDEYRENSIVKSHIPEDKEANALTMQIKIEDTALKGQTAVQAFETFSQMSVKNDKLLNNLMNIVQKNPPQTDEKIGRYFVRLANEDLIEIDDTIDHFINLFNI
jgi:hypothetical protein